MARKFIIHIYFLYLIVYIGSPSLLARKFKMFHDFDNNALNFELWYIEFMNTFSWYASLWAKGAKQAFEVWSLNLRAKAKWPNINILWMYSNKFVYVIWVVVLARIFTVQFRSFLSIENQSHCSLVTSGFDSWEGQRSNVS